MDVVLLDGLLDMMEKGQKIGSTFTPTAYASVANLMGTKCKKAGVTSSNVKHRIKTLKKTFAAAQKVVSQSGFGFNESTQMLEAEPHVWSTYLAVNPDAKSFRYKPVLNYYKLDLLFGKDRATESGAVGPKERNLQSTKETGGSTEDTSLPTNEESSSAFQMKDQVESKKRKSRAKEFAIEELKSLKSGMEAVAMALERGNSRNYTEENLYEEISKVGSLSEMVEMKVYQALTVDPNSARAFHACPIARRDLWLKVKFGEDFPK